MRTSEPQRDEPQSAFTYIWDAEVPRPSEGYDDDLVASTLPIFSVVLLSLPGLPLANQLPNYCPSAPVANVTLPWPSALGSVDKSV